MGKTMEMRAAWGDAMLELTTTHPNVMVLDADLASSTMAQTVAYNAPEFFLNLGIAEQNMMGVAAGMAASGKVVFASSFAVFATGRCWDQIRQSIAYPKLNVKIVATHAGISVGPDGASHQTMEDILRASASAVSTHCGARLPYFRSWSETQPQPSPVRAASGKGESMSPPYGLPLWNSRS